MEVVFLKSPNRLQGIPQLSDPGVEFAWFEFNPNAPLEDVIPLVTSDPSSPSSIKELEIDGREARRFVIRGNINAMVDGDGVAFETEYYLLRLTEQKLLKIQITYGEESVQDEYSDDVQTLLASVDIK